MPRKTEIGKINKQRKKIKLIHYRATQAFHQTGEICDH